MKFDHFHINEGDTVVNLGAHRGAATTFYSNRVGETGFVLSVEPEQENFLELHNTMEKYGNVWTAQFAIGEETKTGFLNVGTNNVNHSTVRTFEDGERQEVEIITWDDLITKAGLTEVHIANVDVEGSECEWLRGMTHTYPKHIVMEEHSRFAYPFEELEALLREKGYMWVREGIHLYATR